MNTTEKYIRFLLLTFMIFIKAGYLFAQIDHKKLQFEAEKAFLNEDYKLALNNYERISEKGPEMIYRKALCLFYLNSFDSSLTCFQSYLKYKKHNNDALFFTAHCFHLLENYKKAVELYRSYLKKSSPKSPYREDAKLLMLQAANAEIVKRSEQYALMMPLSEILNSAKDDYSPIENPRYPGQYFYSSSRNLNLTIFTENFSDTKTKALRLDSRYNASKDQQIVAFPDKGFQILYLRNSKLVIDNFKDGYDQSLAVELKGFEKWNILDAHLINDSLLIFSSDMPEGYGRSDIYIARRDAKGNWVDIKNLGPKVNSAFDEKTPYLADNTIQLFFSSNRPESIGGFDIFRIDLSTNDTPLVFTYPINTTGDELYFRPKSNSNEAWLSSARKNGYGGLDNYRLLFRDKLLYQNDSIVLLNILFKATEQKNKIDVLVNKVDDSIVLSTLNYDSSGKFEALSDKILDELASYMLKYPDLNLLISGHSDDSDSKEIALLQTLAQAEKAALSITKKGISENRIYLRGLAGQYPEAKNKKFDASPDLTGMMINKRIEFNLYSTENKSVKIINKEKMISSVLKETAAENYLENIQGLSFKIDLAGVDNNKNFEFLSKMNDATVEKNASNPKISFSVGLSKKFEAISILLETIKESGFNQAYIRPYWDGFPMDINNVEDKLNEEPELQKYKEYLLKSGK